MTDEKQTPLLDLMRSVPESARLIWEDAPYSSNVAPVGKYLHEAAKRIAEFEAERDALRAALDRIAHHGPPMLASGEYRQGAQDALETVRKIANAALAAKGEK